MIPAARQRSLPGTASPLRTPLFLSGTFVPRVELLRLQLSRLHASKAILVFSAIVLKQGIPALPFRPQGNGAHFPAGAAFLVKRPATIFGVGTARQGKVSPAVFAHPHLHFPLDALPEVVVNEVIDHLRLQNLCKHFIVDELKANRLHTEPKARSPAAL